MDRHKTPYENEFSYHHIIPKKYIFYKESGMLVKSTYVNYEQNTSVFYYTWTFYRDQRQTYCRSSVWRPNSTTCVTLEKLIHTSA